MKTSKNTRPMQITIPVAELNQKIMAKKGTTHVI